MIFWPCCCDKDCSCIGCATLKIEGASSHPDYGTSDVYTELAYNRTVVMWDKDNSTDTPFDLLGTPGDCGDDYTNYPGTKCKGQSFACCSAHYYDDTIEPVPMVVGGVTQTPPTPEAGSDCFPALSCFYDVSQPTIWLTKPEQPTHHYYVDTSGYVWLAIVSYEFVEALQALRPHWIFIYKSSEVVDCQTITSVGAGTLFTMTAVCDGLAAGVEDCSAILVPLLDLSAATITLKVYPQAVNCCNLEDPAFDPCNDDEGACGADVPCDACPDGVASNRYLIEIEGAGDSATGCDCSLLNGSYVLDHAGVGLLCCYEVCTNVDMPCDSGFIISNVKSIKIRLCFGLITGPFDPSQVFGVSGVVYGYTDLGCTSTSEILLTFEKGFWNIVGGVPQPPYPGAPSDCVNINRYELTETNFGCDATNLRIYLTAI